MFAMLATLAAPPPPPPAPSFNANRYYIVLETNRDHASCLKDADALLYTYFLPYVDDNKPCFYWPLDGTAQQAETAYMSPSVTRTGVTLNFFTDDGCSAQSSSPPVHFPFQTCIGGSTVDLTFDLPTPVPGRALIEQWPGQKNCDYTKLTPYYTLRSTRCASPEDYGDQEIVCGEGVNDAFNSASIVKYESSDASCTGAKKRETKISTLSSGSPRTPSIRFTHSQSLHSRTRSARHLPGRRPSGL